MQKLAADRLEAARRHAIGRLLLVARRDFVERANAHVRRRGFQPLSEAAIALLPHLDPAGVRASVLVERTGLTKQRIGKILEDLQRAGLIERASDRADARAATIRFTRDGLARFYATLAAVRAVEREYARAIGAQELERLRKTLSRLAYGVKLRATKERK